VTLNPNIPWYFPIRSPEKADTTSLSMTSPQAGNRKHSSLQTIHHIHSYPSFGVPPRGCSTTCISHFMPVLPGGTSVEDSKRGRRRRSKGSKSRRSLPCCLMKVDYTQLGDQNESNMKYCEKHHYSPSSSV